MHDFAYILPFHILQLAGVIYMSPDIAAIMLSLHTFPPLDSCTYVGLDHGAQPLSVSSINTRLVSAATIVIVRERARVYVHSCILLLILVVA